MKKIYTLFLIAASSLAAWSQPCTPGTYPAAGIYPPAGSTVQGTQINLPEGAVGSYYEQIIDLVVPTDTLIDTLGTALTANIDSLVVYDVVGLPAGMSYVCNTSTCGWAGGTSGCIQMYGTPTTMGTTNIVVYVDAHARLFGLPVVQSDVINNFYITVNAPVGLDEQLELALDLFPNPATHTLNLTLETKQPFYAQVFDAMGRQIFEVRATDSARIDVSSWPSGLYSVLVESQDQRVVRKVVIQ